MEEIITVGNKQYKISSTASLTQEQKNEVIKQLGGTPGCSSCGGSNNKIVSLATTCTTSPIKRGTTKNIPCTIDNPSSLIPGYIYKLYTYGSLYATYPTSGTTTSTSYTFPNVPFNTVGASVAVKLEVSDSCVGNTIGTATCNLIIQEPAVKTVVANYVSPCTGSIVVGTTCTLSATCTDQFDAAIACGTTIWTSRDTAIATVNSSTGVVTGVSVGTARIYATAGGINSADKNVTVTAIPCTTPTCGFTIA